MRVDPQPVSRRRINGALPRQPDAHAMGAYVPDLPGNGDLGAGVTKAEVHVEAFAHRQRAGGFEEQPVEADIVDPTEPRLVTAGVPQAGSVGDADGTAALLA
jgi:hypothetical protein